MRGSCGISESHAANFCIKVTALEEKDAIEPRQETNVFGRPCFLHWLTPIASVVTVSAVVAGERLLSNFSLQYGISGTA